MRNVLIVAGLLAYLALVVVLSLLRDWSSVIPLLALAGLVENIAHSGMKE